MIDTVDLIQLGAIAGAALAVLRLLWVLKDQGAREQRVLDRLDGLDKKMSGIEHQQELLHAEIGLMKSELHELTTTNAVQHGELDKRLAVLETQLENLSQTGCSPAKS